ncbi:MAG: M48 family metalloprotease, partial [Planctomycetales bacterium]|nr:M48 family metalloprotease [Planctomycetales bacterium]
MTLDSLAAVRFEGDLRDAEEISRDELLQAVFRDHQDDWAIGSVRQSFLADAVRIHRRLLPDLDRAVDELAQRLGLDGAMECYVHAYPSIQAGVARSADGYIIVLSSTAVERLSPPELEFVIGHEL